MGVDHEELLTDYMGQAGSCLRLRLTCAEVGSQAIRWRDASVSRFAFWTSTSLVIMLLVLSHVCMMFESEQQNVKVDVALGRSDVEQGIPTNETVSRCDHNIECPQEEKDK